MPTSFSPLRMTSILRISQGKYCRANRPIGQLGRSIMPVHGQTQKCQIPIHHTSPPGNTLSRAKPNCGGVLVVLVRQLLLSQEAASSRLNPNKNNPGRTFVPLGKGLGSADSNLAIQLQCHARIRQVNGPAPPMSQNNLPPAKSGYDFDLRSVESLWFLYERELRGVWLPYTSAKHDGELASGLFPPVACFLIADEAAVSFNHQTSRPDRLENEGLTWAVLGERRSRRGLA